MEEIKKEYDEKLQMEKIKSAKTQDDLKKKYEQASEVEKLAIKA